MHKVSGWAASLTNKWQPQAAATKTTSCKFIKTFKNTQKVGDTNPKHPRTPLNTPENTLNWPTEIPRQRQQQKEKGGREEGRQKGAMTTVIMRVGSPSWTRGEASFLSLTSLCGSAANIAISFNNKIFGQHGEWILHLEDSRIEREREGGKREVRTTRRQIITSLCRNYLWLHCLDLVARTMHRNSATPVQTLQCFAGNLCANTSLLPFPCSITALIAHTPRVPPGRLLNAA